MELSTLSRRYYALTRAAAEAKNPEFKDLWKRKLNELVKNSKAELAKKSRQDERLLIEHGYKFE